MAVLPDVMSRIRVNFFYTMLLVSNYFSIKTDIWILLVHGFSEAIIGIITDLAVSKARRAKPVVLRVIMIAFVGHGIAIHLYGSYIMV